MPITLYDQRRDFEDYPVGSLYPQEDGEWVRYRDHLAAVQEFETALTKIIAIPHKGYGGDWDEIEEAQKIACAALGVPYAPTYTDGRTQVKP